MGECADAVVEGFAEPTEERLSHLGPGCFVQRMEACGTCCWVELTSDGEDSFEAVAHPALNEGDDSGMFEEGEQIEVRRDQITALGCDRYCFC